MTTEARISLESIEQQLAQFLPNLPPGGIRILGVTEREAKMYAENPKTSAPFLSSSLLESHSSPNDALQALRRQILRANTSHGNSYRARSGKLIVLVPKKEKPNEPIGSIEVPSSAISETLSIQTITHELSSLLQRRGVTP